MRDLLEKWAALEPERGGLTNPDHSQRWVRHSGERWYFFVEDRTALASVLAATIEALTARDWDWSVGNNLQRPYRAQVDTKTRTTIERADTPAEALLTAYLAALEAEGALREAQHTRQDGSA